VRAVCKVGTSVAVEVGERDTFRLEGFADMMLNKMQTRMLLRVGRALGSVPKQG
jgi:hypothetical protein